MGLPGLPPTLVAEPLLTALLKTPMALHQEPGVPDTPVTSEMEERILDRLRESMQALFREHAREISGSNGGNQSSSADQQQQALVTTQPIVQGTVDVQNPDEKD